MSGSFDIWYVWPGFLGLTYPVIIFLSDISSFDFMILIGGILSVGAMSVTASLWFALFCRSAIVSRSGSSDDLLLISDQAATHFGITTVECDAVRNVSFWVCCKPDGSTDLESMRPPTCPDVVARYADKITCVVPERRSAS